MNTSETITELAAALAKAQAAIQPAIKDKTNPAFKSRYADLASVWDACREALTSNGLSIVQLPIDGEPNRVTLTTLLLHASGQFISTTFSTPLMKQDPQGIGSALSYLRRYALSSMVGVVADDDDDGNAASRQPTRPASYEPAPPVLPSQQPKANGTNRQSYINRVMTLAGEAKAAGLEIVFNKAVETMSIEELTAAGTKLKGALAEHAAENTVAA